MALKNAVDAKELAKGWRGSLKIKTINLRLVGSPFQVSIAGIAMERESHDHFRSRRHAETGLHSRRNGKGLGARARHIRGLRQRRSQ